MSGGCMLCVRMWWKRKTENSFAELVRHKNKQKHKLGRSPVKMGGSHRLPEEWGYRHIGKKTIFKNYHRSRGDVRSQHIMEKTRQKHHGTKYLTDQLSKYTYTGRDETPDVTGCGLTCLHIYFALMDDGSNFNTQQDTTQFILFSIHTITLLIWDARSRLPALVRIYVSLDDRHIFQGSLGWSRWTRRRQ